MEVNETYSPNVVEGWRSVVNPTWDKIVLVALRILETLSRFFQKERPVVSANPEIMREVVVEALRIEIRNRFIVAHPDNREKRLFTRVVQELDLPRVHYQLIAFHGKLKPTFLRDNNSKSVMDLLYMTFGHPLVLKFYFNGETHYLLGISGYEYFLRHSPLADKFYYFHPDGHERDAVKIRQSQERGGMR